MENLRVEAASAASDARRSGEARSRSYTIGDLAREFGVSLRTLRFYEDRGDKNSAYPLPLRVEIVYM